MLAVKNPKLILLGVFLVFFLALTRSHHFAAFNILPDASWAIFFIAGFYSASTVLFSLLFLAAVAADAVSITLGGVSASCISPAYFFLLPTYGILWLAGRWYAKRYQWQWTTLFTLAISVVVSSVLAELISSGSFYFLSGQFSDPQLNIFVDRLFLYFPQSLQAMLFYMLCALTAHVLGVIYLKNKASQENLGY